LTASTANCHLRHLGYDHERMTRQPPAVRFQAEYANALWHFDMSPSDLKHLKAPAWIDADRQPETEAEANRWLACFIATYNHGDHRSEPHARIDDWLAHLPADGIRQMCAWERFCVFAREPERRLVGIDCRLTVADVTYEVDAELAGETVVVWWGLFDQELWVENGEERLGPFRPAAHLRPISVDIPAIWGPRAGARCARPAR